MLNFVDKLILRLSGEVDYALPQDKQYSIIRTNLIDATGGCEKDILVTSSQLSQCELEIICEGLAQSLRNGGREASVTISFEGSKEGYRFVAAHGIQKSAHAIDIACTADGAILVEAKKKSLYPQIEKCLQQLADVGCAIYGCVVRDE